MSGLTESSVENEFFFDFTSMERKIPITFPTNTMTFTFTDINGDDLIVSEEDRTTYEKEIIDILRSYQKKMTTSRLQATLNGRGRCKGCPLSLASDIIVKFLEEMVTGGKIQKQVKNTVSLWSVDLMET